jgi:hypothetical protein
MTGEVIYMNAGKSVAVVVANDIYLCVVGVSAGVIVGSSFVAIGRYIERRRILRSPDAVIIKNSPRYRRFIRRIINQLGHRIILQLNKSVTGQDILTLYRHLAGDPGLIEALRILGKTCKLLIKAIIIGRSIVMLIGAGSFYLRTRDNLFIVAVNTLKLFAYSKSRSVMVNCAFVAIVTLTATIWCAVPEIRAILKVWVCITILNLSGQITFASDIVKTLPIGAFGVPRIERPIPQLNYNPFNENVPNSKISIGKKEDQLDLSLPLQKESIKSIVNNTELEPSKITRNLTKERELELETAKNLELETAKIIQNSTLGEETILVPKQQESQKTKISRFKSEKYSQLKPRKRTNNLQNLKNTSDINSPLTLENEVEEFSNISNVEKIKEGKVK